MLVRAGRHQLRADGKGVSEPRAGGAHVESPGVRRTDLVLHQAGRAGKEHVGRGRADHDDTYVVGRQPGLTDGAQRRLLRQIGGRNALVHDVTLANPGALQDPLVRGCDQLLQVGVRQQTGRHISSQRRNPRASQRRAAAHSSTRSVGHVQESLRCGLPEPGSRGRAPGGRNSHTHDRSRPGRAACGR